jgi:hypothetical protein
LVPGVRQRYGLNEDLGQSGKVEAFADDTTPMGKLSEVAILAIKNILVDFSVISGLKCNIEKSQILIVGATEPVPDYVTNSGFAVTNKLNILGFDITKNADDLQKNYEKVTEKIRSMVRFWERFRLSLPGRINVAKSLLLSQIGYYGSVIPVHDEQILALQTLMNNFIAGKLRLGAKQITMATKNGGLGFIDLKTFLMSLQCSWVKRAYNSTIDTWRLELNRRTGGNVLITTPRIFNPVENPILHGISTSFFEFKACFYKRNDNFLTSFILGNPLIYESLRPKVAFDTLRWLDPDPDLNDVDTVKELKIMDFIDNGTVIAENIPNILRRRVDPVDRINIKKVIEQSVRYNTRNNTEINYLDPEITVFLTRFKKGSRQFRNIFEEDKNMAIKIRNETRTKTFFRLIGLPVPDAELCHNLNNEWNTLQYPVKLREFVFKFRNNLLGLNTRVSHFNG